MNAEEKNAYLEEALSQALEEIQRLQEQVRALLAVQTQLQEVRGELQQTQGQLKESQEQLQKAHERIAELEKQKTPPPAFVKANTKKQQEGEKKPRQKRDAQDNKGRPRSQPTEIAEHRAVNCPQCHQRLGGITLARQREVIDIPPPPQVVITDHRIYKGWCSNCQKWHETPVDEAPKKC
jgi:chromosome segregation ATPase